MQYRTNQPHAGPMIMHYTLLLYQVYHSSTTASHNEYRSSSEKNGYHYVLLVPVSVNTCTSRTPQDLRRSATVDPKPPVVEYCAGSVQFRSNAGNMLGQYILQMCRLPPVNTSYVDHTDQEYMCPEVPTRYSRS